MTPCTPTDRGMTKGDILLSKTTLGLEHTLGSKPKAGLRIALLVALATLGIGTTSCSGNKGESGGESEAKSAQTPARPTFYGQDVDNQVRLLLYDPVGNGAGQTVGTYVDADIVAAQLSAVRGVHSMKLTAMDNKSVFSVYGYTAYDFANDIVLLRVGKRCSQLAQHDTAALAPTDTLFSIEGTYKGKMLKRGARCSDGTWTAADGTPEGSGLWDNDGLLHGLVLKEGKVVSVSTLDSIRRHQTAKHASVYDLRLKTGRTYISHTRVAGFRIETTMGNIEIKLYDDVPTYRDNFIRLVSDHYYDSLLVHRILPNFIIQTGAADTKYAKGDDVMGWQGPGYTLPMETRPHHFHERGAVAASKLPQERNSANRCDGGQFYIVSGRTFSDTELDKMAREQRKTFSAAQRKAYKTVGGAPHLDGDYVVFGHVTKGMDVVDRIAAVPVDGDRPTTEIRVMKISIITK